MSGDGKLDPQSCETANGKLFRRGCITTKNLTKDHALTMSDIDIKRPAQVFYPVI